jgi:hypothetical protein
MGDLELQEEKEKIQREIDEIDQKIAMFQERGEYELVVKELGKAIVFLNKLVPRQHGLPILQSIAPLTWKQTSRSS